MTTASIETNLGKISFKLLPELAPETVRNFEKLAKRWILQWNSIS